MTASLVNPARGRPLAVAAAIGLAAAATVALALGVPTDAGAHATMERANPAAGSIQRRAPSHVELRFSEAVESGFGALRVFDSEGSRIDEGRAYHPRGEGSKLAVRLSDAAPRGSATVTWRVVSADGHVVSGGYVFSIGARSQSSRSVAELTDAREAGAGVAVALAVARSVQFAAIAVGLGAVLFLLLTWDMVERSRSSGTASSARELRRRLALLVRWSAVAGLFASLLGLVAQGALAGGTGVASGLSPDVLRDVVGTRFGTVWAAAAFAWSILLAGAGLIERRSRAAALLGPPLAWIAATPALSGHATTIEPTGPMAAAGIIHVCAMSAWAGGVVALAACALPALGRFGSARLVEATVGRFSKVAIWSVALVVATGLVQSILALQGLSAFATTDYGRIVLAKVALVLILVAGGVIMRTRVIPVLGVMSTAADAAGKARRVLLVETALFAAVLLATGLLAARSPVAAGSDGPVTRTAQAGALRLELTVDPATVGDNTVHLYLTDRSTGALDRTADSVAVGGELEGEGLGSPTQSARRAGPGHWIVAAAPFPIAGRWRVTVTARTSEFEEEQLRVEVPVD